MGAREMMKIRKHCEALYAALPLSSIRNEQGYAKAVDHLNELLDAGGADESNPLAVVVHQLGETIAVYETKHHPLPDLAPCEMLRYLMLEHGITQSGLPEVGSQGVVSEILSGKRQLNTRQIAHLSKHFGVPEGVFFSGQ